jgi:hypothetical protein
MTNLHVVTRIGKVIETKCIINFPAAGKKKNADFFNGSRICIWGEKNSGNGHW